MTKSATPELKVFIASQESTCDECGQHLGRHAWITLQPNPQAPQKAKAFCLSCADLDHLVFLPSGDAALTRRSRKHSRLSAVVLKWSRARKQYERQGVLVETDALEQAERECEADAGQREMRRAQAVLRRAELDQDYIRRFAARVRELFPHCPAGREQAIAEHACRKYSGRVGRSAEAKELSERAVNLAVFAHIRHAETDYDDLLAGGRDRLEAREQVRPKVLAIQTRWQGP
ncbi:MAG TPA: DUF2293 domain-containing protein [Kiritimatiellia bacterium]|nr:DUF2293 domain-containing protein [Kiritimatiellia bacterium]